MTARRGCSKVGAGSQDGQLDAAVPDFSIGFDAVSEDRYSFGYPASGKYDGGRLKNYMFGPKFGPKTQAVYNAARGATSNETVN